MVVSLVREGSLEETGDSLVESEGFREVIEVFREGSEVFLVAIERIEGKGEAGGWRGFEGGGEVEEGGEGSVGRESLRGEVAVTRGIEKISLILSPFTLSFHHPSCIST